MLQVRVHLEVNLVAIIPIILGEKTGEKTCKVLKSARENNACFL